MSVIDVTLKLPEELVAEAREAGILTAERIAQLLAAELERKKRVKELFDDIGKLHALDTPPMSMEEINAEIHAYRREKRAGKSR